ncbi:MAG: hypothetical protein V1843_00605 [bacterium]
MASAPAHFCSEYLKLKCAGERGLSQVKRSFIITVLLIMVILAVYMVFFYDRATDEQKVNRLVCRYFDILLQKEPGYRYDMLSDNMKKEFKYYAHEAGFPYPQNYNDLYEKLFANDEGLISYNIGSIKIEHNIALVNITLKYKGRADKTKIWLTNQGTWRIGK